MSFKKNQAKILIFAFQTVPFYNTEAKNLDISSQNRNRSCYFLTLKLKVERNCLQISDIFGISSHNGNTSCHFVKLELKISISAAETVPFIVIVQHLSQKSE